MYQNMFWNIFEAIWECVNPIGPPCILNGRRVLTLRFLSGRNSAVQICWHKISRKINFRFPSKSLKTAQAATIKLLEKSSNNLVVI